MNLLFLIFCGGEAREKVKELSHEQEYAASTGIILAFFVDILYCKSSHGSVQSKFKPPTLELCVFYACILWINTLETVSSSSFVDGGTTSIRPQIWLKWFFQFRRDETQP